MIGHDTSQYQDNQLKNDSNYCRNDDLCSLLRREVECDIRRELYIAFERAVWKIASLRLAFSVLFRLRSRLEPFIEARYLMPIVLNRNC